MEAQARAPDGSNAAGRRCEACETESPSSARYCKRCGAAFSPPSACPGCKTELPNDARFCPSCGLKVVGLRPIRDTTDGDTPARPTNETARAEMKALAESLPKAQPTGKSSNLVGNVLLFVAACAIFIVVMYVVNKDAPPEHNPMQGGPPPMKGAAAEPSREPAQPAAAAGVDGPPIQGTVKVDPALKDSVPASGSLFIMVRRTGMPERGVPPVAVKKIQDPKLPVSFSIGPADVMMPGNPFDGPFDLHVRFDADGDAMTKLPGDLVLAQPKSGLKPGQNDVELVLDKRL